MKYPILNIYSSAGGTLEYHIYRFKNKMPNISVENLINDYKPVSILSEYRDPIVEKEIKNFKLSVEEHPIGEDEYIALSAPFDINYANTKYSINLKNDRLAIPYIKLVIELLNYEIVKVDIFHDKELQRTITNNNEIEEVIRKLKNNSILLSDKYKQYNTISLDFTSRVLELLDNGKTNPTSSNIQPAHGVFDPVISTIETSDSIIFYQEEDKHKTTYYYKIIGKRTDAYLTELSRTIVTEVAQSSNSIIATLESSDDFHTSEEPTWKVIESKVVSKELVAKKSKEHMAVDTFDVLKPNDIHVDDSELALSGLRELKIVNIWHKHNRAKMLRNKKVFRVKNSMNSITTKYCDPIKIPGQLEVLVDKIVIFRKKQTTTNNSHIPVNDPDSEILKIFVRQGGVYFKDFFLNDIGINSDDEHKVAAITMDSRFPLLTVKDHCLRSYKYKYTIYLYDEFERVSPPITIVV